MTFTVPLIYIITLKSVPMTLEQAGLAPILQKKKQGLRKAEYFTQGHTACS